MSLLDAAYADSRDSIQLEAAYKAFQDGTNGQTREARAQDKINGHLHSSSKSLHRSQINKKSNYKVEIGKSPSCGCADFEKNSGKELCKHIIWTLLNI